MREGEFFTRARTKANLTQTEVAHALGYDCGQFISNIERDLATLPNDKVRPFCALTRASVLGYLRLKINNSTRKLRQEILHD